ncbi:hypothetical protein [Streptodolium elevatio]|uniref:Uncharacterized protein n=1 Tax=Streptodolium elevatio TaxID=3157996 RepID=A0ABV3DSS2_9ACTN
MAVVPELAGMYGQRLPVEDYLLQPDQVSRIQAARRALVVRCMRSKGIDFGFPAAAGPHSSNAGKTQSEMRYVTPPEVAAKFGYHSPDGQGQAPESPGLPKATEEALFGKDGKSGCYAEVDEDFDRRALLVQDAESVVAINIDNMARSMEDPRMKAAFALWSGCMKARGYAYGTPMEASADPRWIQRPTATPEEIATAVAHTSCMTETNIVGTWFAVESAYEQRDIEAKAAELAAYKTVIENTLRFADSVLAQP